MPEPLEENDAKKVAKEIILKPPSWMRQRIINLPFSVKIVAVSTTVSPVTQQALVDVKIASSHVRWCSAIVISGR